MVPPTIRAILFDSADVLVEPIVSADAPDDEPWRRWFPGPKFDPMVRARYPDLNLDGLDDAITLGMAELDRLHEQPIRTIKQETEHFAVFYRIVLEILGVPNPDLAYELARVRVNEPSMQPYPEVPEVLTWLHSSGLRLGVLSEAWPSLEVNYYHLGLRDFFHAFVISANEGLLKDDLDLFGIARNRLDVPAETILFLDDWAPYVQNAISLGFQGAVVARKPVRDRIEGLVYVKDLYEVEGLVQASS